jgi:hypothetical protein
MCCVLCVVCCVAPCVTCLSECIYHPCIHTHTYTHTHRVLITRAKKDCLLENITKASSTHYDMTKAGASIILHDKFEHKLNSNACGVFTLQVARQVVAMDAVNLNNEGTYPAAFTKFKGQHESRPDQLAWILAGKEKKLSDVALKHVIIENGLNIDILKDGVFYPEEVIFRGAKLLNEIAQREKRPIWFFCDPELMKHMELDYFAGNTSSFRRTINSLRSSGHLGDLLDFFSTHSGPYETGEESASSASLWGFRHDPTSLHWSLLSMEVCGSKVWVFDSMLEEHLKIPVKHYAFLFFCVHSGCTFFSRASVQPAQRISTPLLGQRRFPHAEFVLRTLSLV